MKVRRFGTKPLIKVAEKNNIYSRTNLKKKVATLVLELQFTFQILRITRERFKDVKHTPQKKMLETKQVVKVML